MKNFSLYTLLALTLGLFAQNKKDTEYSGFFDSYYFRGPLNFIIGGGVTGYSGDLYKRQPSYILGVGASYKVWPRTYFGAQFNYLNLRAQDKDTIRNISFTNNMMELYGYCRFNILDKKMLKNMDVKSKEMTFRPYLMLGFGVNNYTAKSSTPNARWSKDSIPENANYPKTGIFIPAGIGFAFFITHRISILAEFNYRFPFTDYIDDVSARGGNTRKDVYYSGELKLQYAPFAPKRKKKHKFTEPAPYGGKVTGPPAPPTKPSEEQNGDNPIQPAEDNKETTPPDSTTPQEGTTPPQSETKPQDPPAEDGWPTEPPKKSPK